jgi:hypothetical protein
MDMGLQLLWSFVTMAEEGNVGRAARRLPAAPGAREYGRQWWTAGHWRTYWCRPGRRRPEDR